MSTKISCPTNVLEGSNKTNYLHIGPTVAGKIIRLLRDSIYSEKWGSLIREVIANAYDANKENNYEGPVEITLPSLLSEELTIRDYGKGMSKEFMETCYTNVGLSTKELDMNQTGAFGLGRLTPLLKSDSYKIETNHSGMKYIYTMAVGERDGLILEWENTTTDTGTVIRIPCDNSNNNLIKDAIKQWCEYMVPIPLVNGIPLEVSHEFTSFPGLEDKNYWCCKSSSYNNEVILLNDWVPYTLNKNSLDGVLQQSLNTLTSNRLRSYHFVIKLPNGALDIVTSREDIAYTNKTLSTISKTVKSILKELQVSLEEQLKDINTLREAILLVNEFPKFNGDSIIWNGIDLNKLFLQISNFEGCTYTYSNYKLNQSRWTKSYNSSYKNLINEKHVFIDDLVRKHKADRIQHYLKNQLHNTELFLVNPSALNDDLVKQLDWPLLSSLEMPPKVVSTQSSTTTSNGVVIRTNKKEIKVYEWKGRWDHNASLPKVLSFTTPTSIPSDTSGICLVTKRGDVIKGLEEFKGEVRYIISELLKFIPSDKGPLYLIPESNTSLLKGNWQLLNDAVYETLGDRLQEYKDALSYKYCLVHHPNVDSKYDWVSTNKNLVWLTGKISSEPNQYNLSKDNVLIKYIDESLKLKNYIEENDKAIQIVKLLNKSKEISETVESQRIKDLISEINLTYPLISNNSLDFHYCPSNYVFYIIDYIKGIDLLNKQGLSTV